MEAKQIEVRFGAMAPPLKEQVPELPEKDAARLEQAAFSVTYLSVHGFLTDTEKAKARKRIMKAIVDAATEAP
jgi:hypothetical protein